MAISKILNMKDTGSSYHGKHLKASLAYIMNPEKTQDGRLVGAVNCTPENPFEQMRDTKHRFGKIGGRQGYHIILSFPEGEASPDLVYEISQKFVSEYLKDKYEAVFVVHDNTDCLHSHIVFNSVSFIDGRKFRYEKGDWARIIQPITNRLCEEYGLSTIEIEEEQRGRNRKNSEHYKEWNEIRDGKFVWSDMIKRDVEACILQSSDYEDFLEMMQEKGYEVKQGKHLAVKPQGMSRFRRLDTLSDEYELEQLKKRIAAENIDLTSYRQEMSKSDAKIVRCFVKRYRRAKLSGLQKRYYARLYQLGQLKKRPYSQAWKYRDDIRKMHQLQEQYNFLSRHDITNAVELASVITSLTDKKKEAGREKGKVYRIRQKMKPLFEIADQMAALSDAENAYQSGDEFFKEEHEKWVALEKELRVQGYSLSEVQELSAYYKEQSALTRRKHSEVEKELRTGEAVWKSMYDTDGKVQEQSEEKLQKEEERTQPRR